MAKNMERKMLITNHREMQIEATRYHITHVRMAVIKRPKIAGIW